MSKCALVNMTPGWNAPHGVENVHALYAGKPEPDDGGNNYVKRFERASGPVMRSKSTNYYYYYYDIYTFTTLTLRKFSWLIHLGRKVVFTIPRKFIQYPTEFCNWIIGFNTNSAKRMKNISSWKSFLYHEQRINSGKMIVEGKRSDEFYFSFIKYPV